MIAYPNCDGGRIYTERLLCLIEYGRIDPSARRKVSFLGSFLFCRFNYRHGDFQSITLSFLTSSNSLTY